ncbi:hypothetical protein TPHA_0L01200 [Tetrapisispora phaffii CBS 4417]|uniref:Pre-mRNA-splicing factor CWC2 n=1 Tax=Tetrapisispora phaffii (strain ATCC 24235 / CBS 4417 / NBRC 1672 / NRRL Y-8282 / UCD 70-5) TaxID=1071381 RepID=G8BZZ9_TETPH|nr:hypothetical protein TPHA_0L01200 [Tetrapisispora phaffii CBS 4417]CCE65477.1 hypothetical protein TPHA_0L01200 [Tetrapisispora phaffii CBS 4417]
MWKNRSAKVQVPESELPSSIPPQVGLSFNVWYNKWSQGQSGTSRYVNPYRLEPLLHSGTTIGDKTSNNFFCLFFAKGMCCLGKKCTYKHHVPAEEDNLSLSMSTDVLDCFGREKFGDYRDDMGGVGSFRKRNRTLYIGGLTGALNNENFKPSQIEGRLRFAFSRLGEIETIRYIEAKNCAFVTYRFQANAEFAKEAMSNQTLLTPSDKKWDERKDGTGLLVKWANDDPDPIARERRDKEETRETLKIMEALIAADTSKAIPVETAPTRTTPNIAVSSVGNKKRSVFTDSLLATLKKRKLPKNIIPPKSKIPLIDYESSSDED